jgi:hypothetical protein
MDHHVWDHSFLFQVVQTQTTTAYCRILPTLDPKFEIYFSDSSDTNSRQLIVEYYLHWTPSLRYLFQVVQTQTTTAYCRTLPLLDHHAFEIYFPFLPSNFTLIRGTLYDWLLYLHAIHVMNRSTEFKFDANFRMTLGILSPKYCGTRNSLF